MIGRRRIRARSDGTAQLRLHDGEAEVLRSVVGQLQELLAADEDPNLRRLFPTAYPDRAELQSEFDEMVRDQLRSSRFDALETIERTASNDALSDDELAAWMRGLNDLRLVLGTRLDVSEEGHDIDPAHPDAGGYALYDWLSVLVAEVVDARSQLLD